jgi:hypothetical protein
MYTVTAYGSLINDIGSILYTILYSEKLLLYDINNIIVTTIQAPAVQFPGIDPWDNFCSFLRTAGTKPPNPVIY